MVIHYYPFLFPVNVKNDKQKILSATYRSKCAFLISFSA